MNIDDFDTADTPTVVPVVCHSSSCEMIEFRRRWLGMLAPGGTVAKLAAMVDRHTARLDGHVRWLFAVTVVLAAGAGFLLGWVVWR